MPASPLARLVRFRACSRGTAFATCRPVPPGYRPLGKQMLRLDMAEKLLQGAREIRGKAERVIDKIR